MRQPRNRTAVPLPYIGVVKGPYLLSKLRMSRRPKRVQTSRFSRNSTALSVQHLQHFQQNVNQPDVVAIPASNIGIISY